MTYGSKKSIPSPARTAAVLAVSPLPADRRRLREILSPRNWELHEASDCSEALAFLRRQTVRLPLCERDQSDGSWEDVLSAAARLHPPPPDCVLAPGRRFSLGGSPEYGWFRTADHAFEPAEILRVTFAAWIRWEGDFCGAPPMKQMRRSARLHPLADVVRPPCRTAGASA